MVEGTIMKVLGIGESVIDEISTVGADGALTPAGRDAGGPALVAMIMLSKLGAECSYVTTLGQDAGGDYIRELLGRAGVRVIERVQPESKVNAILVDGETGQREKRHTAVEYPTISGLGARFLQGFDGIVMDRHERGAFYEVAAGRAARTQLVIDPSTELSGFTLDMMREAQCPVVPIETLAQLDGAGTLGAAAGRLAEMVGRPLVVTLGAYGSLVCEGSGQRLVPAAAVKVVNTLGAGDVFRGAFAYGQLQGWTLDRCARYGNAAAALQCTDMGNAAGVPDKEEIDRLMQVGTWGWSDPRALEEYFGQLCREYSLVAVR